MVRENEALWLAGYNGTSTLEVGLEYSDERQSIERVVLKTIAICLVYDIWHPRAHLP